ncbi:tryptophan dimethylallyltransferase family protein [Actinophytocola sp. NPDC049390]|uniref:tryptophan dimethylallyltransferase family protein n=1 Tax=Actinophytocola sp. NPDC049390 TaxID=3363894 RepID=UPI0037891B11
MTGAGDARTEEHSYVAVAEHKLARMFGAVGASRDRIDEATALLRDVTRPWGTRTVPRRLSYFSAASNDGAPIELSMGWQRDRTEVRATFEPMGADGSPAERLRAATEVTEALGRRPEVSLTRYHRIADLFIPPTPLTTFTAIHSMVWQDERAPWFKIYLNPQAHGRDRADEVVREALHRLGFTEQWELVRQRLAEPELSELDSELVYVALDLRDTDDARVKLYLRHAGAVPEQLEHLAGAAEEHVAGEVADVCRKLSAKLAPKPPITTFTLVSSAARPQRCTVNLPISPNMDNDAEGCRAVTEAFRLTGLDPAPCERALAALITDPEHSHMLNYVGVTGQHRLTVFLSLEAHPVPMTWP